MDDGHFLMGLLIVLLIGTICAFFCDNDKPTEVKEDKEDDIYLMPIVVPGSNGSLDCYVIPTSY